MKNEKEYKKSNWKIIGIAVLIIIIIVGGFIIYKRNVSSKPKEQQLEETNIKQEETNISNQENVKIEGEIKKNISGSLLRDRELNDIKITDIKLIEESGITTFTAIVKNDTEKEFSGGIAKITFINKDGSVYAELEAYIPEIKAGAINVIDAGTTEDIVNAYDFKIELEK